MKAILHNFITLQNSPNEINTTEVFNRGVQK